MSAFEDLEKSLQQHGFVFSRERVEKLHLYLTLLNYWQKKVNLISSKSYENVIERHIIDSLRIIPYIPASCRSFLDLGSGAGFPGMILAICTDLKSYLIESNFKKCVFLQEVACKTKTKCVIYNNRIEKVHNLTPDLITSRALAPLKKLITYAIPFTHKKTYYIFHKGKNVDAEIEEAQTIWAFSWKKISSPNGLLLLISKISPVK